jgi:hypothetical protein
VRCPQCKNKVLQKSENGVRLRTKGAIRFDKDGHCTAQCYWCGTEVQVPVQLTEKIVPEPERFILIKKGT